MPLLELDGYVIFLETWYLNTFNLHTVGPIQTAGPHSTNAIIWSLAEREAEANSGKSTASVCKLFMLRVYQIFQSEKNPSCPLGLPPIPFQRYPNRAMPLKKILYSVFKGRDRSGYIKHSHSERLPLCNPTSLSDLYLWLIQMGGWFQVTKARGYLYLKEPVRQSIHPLLSSWLP